MVTNPPDLWPSTSAHGCRHSLTALTQTSKISRGTRNSYFRLYLYQQDFTTSHHNATFLYVKYYQSFSRSLVLAIPIVLGISAPLHAGTETDPKWSLCTTHPSLDFREEVEENNAIPGAAVLTADGIEAIKENVIHLEGNVRVTYDKQLLKADSAIYDKTTDIVDAKDNIHYQTKGLSIQGNTAKMEPGANTAIIRDTEFQLHDWHARGSARNISIESQDITTLRKVRYTTCDYGNNDWLMKSSYVKLNHATGIGSASNVVLTFMHVPFLYLPYINFPINDERKTGFLTPGYKSSSTTGNEISFHYYMNIAPNIDSTFTPHFISQRGTLLDGEFRFLATQGHGDVNIEYLSDDKLYEGENTRRGSFNFTHTGIIAERFHNNVDLGYVSDKDYLKDFGNGLVAATTVHIKRSAALTYLGDTWSTRALLEGYQTIDETIPESSRPYRMLPQIQLNTNLPLKKNLLNYQLGSEYVFFEQQDRVTGGRLDIQPMVSLPLKTVAAFLTPKVNLHYTQYTLQDQTPVNDATLNRVVPVFTLDSGVFLERDSHWGSKSLLHTLEPRLFYLYAPFRDQSEIPIFDSGAPDFTFGQLFLENRFNGVDRVGDANQVSLSVTSRLLENDTGRERITGSIGQIYYFKDREVNLSGAPADTSTHSDIIAEANTLITNELSANSDLQWDISEDQISKGGIQFRYRGGNRHILNLTYRYRREALEQADISLLWPLTRSWHMIGRWNFSVFDKQDLETLSGLEYQSCCWKLHLVTRHYLLEAPDIYDNTFYVQLELKGLANIGRTLNDILAESVLDYEE